MSQIVDNDQYYVYSFYNMTVKKKEPETDDSAAQIAVETSSVGPTVYSYIDYREYLTDWFAWKKTDNKRFSHRMFARLCGITSPSLLLMVMKGKRNLTPKTASTVAEAIKLNPEQTRFFASLVKFSAAKTDKDKNTYWKLISATRRFQQARTQDLEMVNYLSHWYVPAIRELVGCSVFQTSPKHSTPEWISKALFPKITVNQATKAIDTLVALDMLTIGEDGRYNQHSTTVVTPHEAAGMAVRNYHREMINRSLSSIDSVAKEHRHFGAVTVTVNEKLVPILKQEVGSFQERLLELCDGSELDAEQVYQINIQLFPLSKQLIGTPVPKTGKSQ